MFVCVGGEHRASSCFFQQLETVESILKIQAIKNRNMFWQLYTTLLQREVVVRSTRLSKIISLSLNCAVVKIKLQNAGSKKRLRKL